MGFLNIFKRDNSAATAMPLEYYLEQRSSYMLFGALLYSVLNIVASEKQNGPIILWTCTTAEYLHNDTNFYLAEEDPSGQWEAIPKCHLDCPILPETIIDILRIRNDEFAQKAVFVEAFLYEHGIDDYPRDLEKAAALYRECDALAKQNHPEGHELMLDILNTIKAGRMLDFPEVTYDDCERLAWSLYYLLDEEDEEYADLRALLQNREGFDWMAKNSLARLTAVAIAQYADTHADNKHPLTLAFLGGDFMSDHCVIKQFTMHLSPYDIEVFSNRLLNDCMYIGYEGLPEAPYADTILTAMGLKTGNTYHFIS